MALARKLVLMSALAVFVVFALLVLAFAAANLVNSLRMEKIRKRKVRQLLPPGTSLEEFVRTAPFEYAKVPGGYKVWEKHKSIEEYALLAATEEEAQEYIVLATFTLKQNHRL